MKKKKKKNKHKLEQQIVTAGYTNDMAQTSSCGLNIIERSENTEGSQSPENRSKKRKRSSKYQRAETSSHEIDHQQGSIKWHKHDKKKKD